MSGPYTYCDRCGARDDCDCPKCAREPISRIDWPKTIFWMIAGALSASISIGLILWLAIAIMKWAGHQ